MFNIIANILQDLINRTENGTAKWEVAQVNYPTLPINQNNFNRTYVLEHVNCSAYLNVEIVYEESIKGTAERYCKYGLYIVSDRGMQICVEDDKCQEQLMELEALVGVSVAGSYVY
jgi:hypothetical protein